MPSIICPVCEMEIEDVEEGELMFHWVSRGVVTRDGKWIEKPRLVHDRLRRRDGN